MVENAAVAKERRGTKQRDRMSGDQTERVGGGLEEEEEEEEEVRGDKLSPL